MCCFKLENWSLMKWFDLLDPKETGVSKFAILVSWRNYEMEMDLNIKSIVLIFICESFGIEGGGPNGSQSVMLPFFMLVMVESVNYLLVCLFSCMFVGLFVVGVLASYLFVYLFSVMSVWLFGKSFKKIIVKKCARGLIRIAEYERIKILAKMDENATRNVAKNLRKAISKRRSERNPESTLHHRK